MAKDYFGNELSIGDTVVFMEISYRNLTEGKIVSVAKKKCQIKYTTHYGAETKTSQFHEQIIKHPTKNK